MSHFEHIRRVHCRGWIPALFLCMALVPEAWARKPSLRFSTAVDLPQTGLHVSVMPDSVETPPAPPTTYTYELTRKQDEKSETARVEMYSPVELWRRSQHAARWVDKHTNSLLLAVVTLPPPVEFGQKHVIREEYDRNVAAQSARPVEWKARELGLWASNFLGVPSVEAAEVKRRPFQLSDLLSFALAGRSDHGFAYAFRLRPTAISSGRDVSRWYFAYCDVNPEVDVQAAKERIEKEFLGSVTWARAAVRGDQAPSKTFQKKDSLPAPSDRSPELAASRDTVLESIRNTKDWWYVETRNYIVLSNLGSKYRGTVHELQEDIEAIRSAYEQLIPPPAGEVKAVSVIRIFATPEEYEAYVGPEQKWTSGLWMPSKQELVVRAIDWGGSRERRESVLRTVYHEAFHQYLFYATGKRGAAAWFNEGHATFFEAASVSGRKVVIGEHPHRSKIVEQMAQAGDLPVREMLGMSYPAFYIPSDTVRQQNYALAWGMVYYLRKAAPRDNQAAYGDILRKYVEALAKTGDAGKATESAFEGVDISAFTNDLRKFWQSSRLRAKAERGDVFEAGRK